MTSSLSIRSLFVPLVLAFARARGADVSELIRRFDLPDVEPGNAVVLPLRTVRDVAQAAAELLDEPWLGLKMGQAHRRGTYGVLEFAARSASTIEGALGRVVRYQRLINDRAVFGLDVDGDEARFDHAIPSEPLAGGRHSNEFAVATVLHLLRDLSGVHLPARRAWFSSAPPFEFGALVTFLGTSDLAFDRPSSGFAFDSAALALPLASADPDLLRVLDAQAARFLPAHEGSPFEVDLRRAILEAFQDGAPELGRIGKRLGMSGRTLQRRLAESGKSFQDEVEIARQELAKKHLADPRLSIDEVAFALGYSQTRAFTRAFHRWTGASPHAYRRERRG